MKFNEFHKNIKIRIIETFLSSFVGGMIFPFMTLYLANYFGVKTAGLLLIINVIVGILISFLGGYFSDQFGRKKILVIANVLRFFAFLIMIICNSPWFSFPFITFLMLTINSICWGLSGPANQAMLIDVSTPEQRKYMYSITYWANNFSIAIGGLAGSFLFRDYLFELLISLSIIALLAVILAIFFIEESYIPAVSPKNPFQHFILLTKSYRIVFQDKIFILFVMASFLIFSFELQLTNYIGIKLTNDMPQQYFLFWEIDGFNMLGILRSENTILVIVLIIISPKINKFMKDKDTLISSCLLFSISYGIVSYSNNVIVLIVFMALLTLGEVLRVPIEQSYTASIPPDHARSTYMAIVGLKYNLAMFIASFTVTIGAFFPPLFMSFIITLIGLFGTYIYFTIIPKLETRIEQKN